MLGRGLCQVIRRYWSNVKACIGGSKEGGGEGKGGAFYPKYECDGLTFAFPCHHNAVLGHFPLPFTRVGG